MQNIIETLENGSKIKRDERKNFHLTEVKNVKELRYIDRYSKGIATRSLTINRLMIYLTKFLGVGNKLVIEDGSLYIHKFVKRVILLMLNW